MNYGRRFVTLYRRQESRSSPRKRNAKRKRAVWGGLINSCEKKRSEMSCLSVASVAILFSYSEGCLFTLLIVSFVVQKLLILIRRSNWQTTNLKNIQATPAAQFQKNNRRNQKMGQRTKQTFLQRKTYRWLTNTWKDVQHHSLWDKFKLKPQWGTISRWSEWLLSKSLQTINTGECLEERGGKEEDYTVGANAN